MPKKAFVLVAGAWLGGWVWEPVARELINRGYGVVAPTMPGMQAGEDPAAVSLAHACDHLVAEIERRDLYDCILVAHDWSGFPVTAAVNRVPHRVSAAIYWSAYVPLPGRSHLDEVPDEDREILTAAARAAGGHSVLLPFHRWQHRFIQTESRAVQELTYSLLRPQPWTYRTESVSSSDAQRPRVPVSYLVGSQDLALPAGEGWTEKFATRLGREALVFDATHMAHLTHPLLLADALIEAAKHAD